MSTKLKRVVKKLSSFAEMKREQAIINVSNSTATGLIVKSLLTHKLAVLLIMVILVGGAYYSYELNYYRELADRQRIQELKDDLAVEQARTNQLKEEVQAFKDRKALDDQINEELKKSVTSLSAEKKKKLLLEYKRKLLEKRRKKSKRT
ncbi:MAG: hypothetical protein DRQ40_02020 [Gammaproteobacteria bacterium]|nr:MAG: hypothetical protein DRQ40_02020 [Gammaproteobacteria bacterium]